MFIGYNTNIAQQSAYVNKVVLNISDPSRHPKLDLKPRQYRNLSTVVINQAAFNELLLGLTCQIVLVSGSNGK